MARNRVLERLFLALVDLLSQTRQRSTQTEDRKQKSLYGHRNILSFNQEMVMEWPPERPCADTVEVVEGSIFRKKKGGGRSSFRTSQVAEFVFFTLVNQSFCVPCIGSDASGTP